MLQRFFLFLINTEFSHLLEAISLCWNGIFYGFHKILRTIKLPSPQRKTLELPQHFVLLSGHSGHIYVLGWIPTWLQQAWFLCKLCEKIQWNQKDSFKPTEVATLKAMTLAKGKTKCPTYSCKHRSAAWSQTPSRRLGLGKSLLSMPTGSSMMGTNSITYLPGWLRGLSEFLSAKGLEQCMVHNKCYINSCFIIFEIYMYVYEKWLRSPNLKKRTVGNENLSEGAT